jgi:DNA topoisomerase I
MSKKYSTTTTLLIVESPAKCKKIEEYLGPGYKCIASFGHLRELPSLSNIKIEEGFKPTYQIINNALKKKQIDLLRKEIKKADEVIIATDNDREGEGIGYHLLELFNLPLSTKRIVFNEVTEKALQQAVKTPRTIDMSMVHAQQARQILDLLVGFKITPMLWKFISQNSEKSLSAGRCQTPALRLVYDNQKEIDSADNKKVFNTTGYFTNMNLPFELNHQFEEEDETVDFLDKTADHNHIYNCLQPTKVYKQPPEPFTTSRLQQLASNECHFSPKETMKLCQSLYEGGYITYMRTDSKKYSADFLETAKKYIQTNYEQKYINENIDVLCCRVDTDIETEQSKTKQSKSIKTTKQSQKSKDNLAQEAHEAIRPTKISLKDLPEKINPRERRMYKLIWENTLESCMASAIYNSVKAQIQSYKSLVFQYTSELIAFPGWKIVKNKFSTDSKEFQYLQTIKQNQTIKYNKVVSKVTIKNVKMHYTEARLVQLLEDKGIGRPSTFSMLIDKIQERGYVKKEDVKGKTIIVKDYELENDEISEVEATREFGNEKNKLVLQPLGKIVMEFLDKHFLDLLNYDFTREMEEDLDNISKGTHDWKELCKRCNDKLDTIITQVKETQKSKFEIKIDETHIYTIAKYGPVIKCVEKVDGKKTTIYKSIKKNMEIDIDKLENGGYILEELIDNDIEKQANKQANQINLGKYEDKDVILKKGKFGLYVTCGEVSKTLKQFGNRPIESIQLDEVIPLLEEGSNMVREVSTNISIRKSKKGDYIFFKTSKMKKPKFFALKGFEEDYKTCDIDVLKSWLKEKHDIH